MAKIDYSNPIQGKLFSLAQGKGSLSGTFQPVQKIGPGLPAPGYPSYPPKIPEQIDLGVDRRAELLSNTNIGNCITWSFVPLNGSYVMLTCKNPITDKTHVMTCEKYLDFFPTVVVKNFDLPVNTENVDRRNQFEMIYVEQSPLFFYFKNADNMYLATTPDSITIFGQTLSMLTLFTEAQKNDTTINANCIWFLDSLAEQVVYSTGGAAVIERDNVRVPVSFDKISKNINRPVDKSFLNELMGR